MIAGEGVWGIHKEIIGWICDDTPRCIKMSDKLNATVTEIHQVTRILSISYKRFEKLVGKLWYDALWIPFYKGLFVPFNRTMNIHPKHTSLGKQGIVH